MKKNLLTVLLLTGALFAAKAQTTLFSQDFENVDSINEQQWAAIDIDEDDIVFSYLQTQPVLVELGFTGSVMFSRNFIPDDENNPLINEESDNMLLTAAMNLPANQQVNLSFRISTLGQTQEAVSHYALYVANEDELNSFTSLEGLTGYLTGLPALQENEGNSISSEILNVDLSAYAGQEVRLVIRHFESQGPSYLFVDDFVATSEVLGIPVVTASQFEVYPNPANSIVTIKNADNVLLNEVAIVDLNGRIIKTIEFNAVSEAQINVADLTDGIYLLNITTDKGRITKKIVKG